MANVYPKTVSGGETTTPTTSHYFELDDGATSTYISLTNLLKIINSLTEDTAPTTSDYVLTYDASASAAKKVKFSPILGHGPLVCEARLTLTTALPVTTANVTGATSVFITPYKGNRIALYDGSADWNIRTFTEITVALGTLTSGLPYDIFVYDNAGTVTARSPVAWTNGTTRATALTTQDGVLVKTGATTDRYLGTLYTTSTTETEDSDSKRYLWNYYNRVPRFLTCKDTTDSWNYTTATWQEARAQSTLGTSRVGCIIGWTEDIAEFTNFSFASNSVGGAYVAVGIGIDSSTTNSAQAYGGGSFTTPMSLLPAQYRGTLAVGFHFVARLEISQVSGTTTFYGDAGLTYEQSAMIGTVYA